MSLTKAEKETIIRWDEAERVVHIWTASEPVKRKCRKQGFEEKGIEGEGAWFEVLLSEFRWGKKRKVSSKRAQNFRKAPIEASWDGKKAENVS